MHVLFYHIYAYCVFIYYYVLIKVAVHSHYWAFIVFTLFYIYVLQKNTLNRK